MGGVIFRQDSEEAFRRFREAGLDPEKYMGAFGQKEFFLDVENGKIDADTFCRKMAEASGREHVSWEEAQHCWLGFLRDVPVERLHYLLELKKHYHVCLLSNTNPFMMSFTRSSKFSSDGKPISFYFDTLFCSYEMKAYKPDSEIFIKALDTDKMIADETLFLDDSMKNIVAAQRLGLQTLYVKTNEDWRDRLTLVLQQNR
jgi:HAD superfamily hydrolase (TIGR01509 family)